MDNETEKAVESYLERFGKDALMQKLDAEGLQEDVLTIIANAGVHPFDALHKRGVVFFASQGNLDFTSKESALAEFRRVLHGVASKLMERRWSKVYLVPFGPAPLALQIKSLVHKVLDMETVDVLHVGGGVHIDVEIDPRKIAVDTGQKP